MVEQRVQRAGTAVLPVLGLDIALESDTQGQAVAELVQVHMMRRPVVAGGRAHQGRQWGVDEATEEVE